jgi:hypothetical protein
MQVATKLLFLVLPQRANCHSEKPLSSPNPVRCHDALPVHTDSGQAQAAPPRLASMLLNPGFNIGCPLVKAVEQGTSASGRV